MLEILSARNTQSTVSGINYRKYLHQWMCLPDMQMYVQARKVNEQLSDVSTCLLLSMRNLPILSESFVWKRVGFQPAAIRTYLPVTQLFCFVFSAQIFYKDDLNWLKGIGCYAWDTPEILRVKHAGDLQSEVSPLCSIKFFFAPSLTILRTSAIFQFSFMFLFSLATFTVLPFSKSSTYFIA